MDRRTTTRTPTDEFDLLCLCIALGDQDTQGDAMNELRRLSAPRAEAFLLALEGITKSNSTPGLDAVQTFLSQRMWSNA